MAPGAVNLSVPVYTPGSRHWLLTLTASVRLPPEGTVPVEGETANQGQLSPCTGSSDQFNGCEPGLLTVSVCCMAFSWPSVAVKDSNAGETARTGPALGGNGRTVMSTSMC